MIKNPIRPGRKAIAEQVEEDARAEALKAKNAERLARLVKSSAAAAARDLQSLNTRRRERVATEHPGLVLLEDDTIVPISIVDVSSGGLKVCFDSSQYLPKNVVIDSPVFGGLLVAEVRWQSGAQAGLEIDRDATRELAEALRNEARRQSA